MIRLIRSVRGPRSWIGAAVAVAALIVSAPAVAAPLTVQNPNVPSNTVTIDRTEAAPGERINITGRGFVVTTNIAGPGNPIVAVRPYDYDLGPTWTAGGADHYAAAPPLVTNEAKYWFQTKQDPGQPNANIVGFDGWMEVPQTATPDGPVTSQPGQHWFRILTGAYFTSTGGDNAGRKVQEFAYSYTVPFKIVPNLRLGLQAGTFHEGSTFRPSAVITVLGRGFTPSTSVTATLDGSPLAGVSITTDAEGVFPNLSQITLPPGITPGAHTLAFTTGAVTHTASITVTPPPTATLHTPAVRPGGTFAFDVANFIGVKGTGQKVAVVINEQVLACLQADAQGRASGAATIPADVVSSTTVRFNAGLSCIVPAPGSPPIVNDAPGASVPQDLTVSATAPVVVAPATGEAGSAVTVTGDGFSGSSVVSATYRGVPLPISATTDAQGHFSGQIALPEGLGEGVLLVTAGSGTAATVVTVVGRPAPPPPPVTDPVPPPAKPKPLAVKPSKGALTRTVLTLTLRAAVTKGTSVNVVTRTKVRLTPKAKPRIVVLANAKVAKGKVVRLTLTPAGRRLVAQRRAIAVTVRIAAPGKRTSTTYLTVRRAGK